LVDSYVHWTELARGPGWSDAGGWDHPQYYATIQLADIDGDGHAELLARSASSMLAYGYDPSSQQWALTSAPFTAFPAFAGGRQTAYSYISQQLLGAPRGDIRSQYRNQAAPISTYITVLNTLAPPSDVTPADWEAVKSQILTELRYVQAVNTWFGLNATLITDIFLSEAVSVQRVAATLEIPSDSKEEVVFAVLSMVLNVARNIAALAGPEFALIPGLLSVAFQAAAQFSGGGGSITAEVAELEGKLNTQFTNAVTANGCFQATVAQNWSLLQALGRPIAEGTLVWDDTLTGQLLVAARPAYELSLWQILTPAVWQVLHKKIIDAFPFGYLCRYAYVCRTGSTFCTDPRRTDEQIMVIRKTGIRRFPAEDTLRALFDPPPTGLGVPLADVVLGRNDWRLEGSREC
jgi:hypothetical protein